MGSCYFCGPGKVPRIPKVKEAIEVVSRLKVNPAVATCLYLLLLLQLLCWKLLLLCWKEVK